jgi:phage terminase large subunit-like protein
MDMLRGMLTESPAEKEFGIDVGKGMIQFTKGPGKIVPVTASSRGLEGGRPSFCVMDETHHWVMSNQGQYVYEVIDRNIRKTAKAGSHYVETTNSYNPNEDSVAQRTHEAFLSGARGLLYDCIEADQADIDLKDEEAVKKGLIQAYGDATWADINSLWEAICDPRTPASVAYRFYLNKVQEDANGWMSKAEWDECLDEDDPIKPGDQIAIGFDGSIRGDATGLVGVRLRDAKLFVLGLWQKPEHADEDWEVDVLSVEAAVQSAFDTYRVEWLYADPPFWQENIGRWSMRWEDTVYEFWTNKPTRMVVATERFRTAAMVGDLKHDGNKSLTRHVLNAVTREVPQGTLITKDSPKSKRKIDLAVCAILGLEARADAIADGRLKIRKKRIITM